MRFFWVRKIRKKKVWEKKRKKQAGEFLCCNKTTEPLPKIQAFAPPPPTIQAPWLLLLALGGGVCCVGFLAVCFGLWTFLHV